MTADQNSRQLFGGAIKANVPDSWLDASDLRQVPDNQEVLLSSQSDDLTLIVEVLQSVTEGGAGDDLEAAIRFHFNSLAHDNDAGDADIQQIFALPGTTPSNALAQANATPAPLLLVGEQTVKKFGQGSGQGDRVRIYLALWRLAPSKDVDLVMSLNQPLKGDDNNLGDAEAAAGVAGSVSARAMDVFTRAASSLSIEDWGLFAN